MSVDRDHGHDVEPPRLEEVSDGVFAWLQLHGQWGLNNAAFLVGSDAVTLVDTCFTVKRAGWFLDAIRGVTDKPHRVLLNTHHHGDHTYGNFLVKGATIIGHRVTREEMISTGLSTQKLFQDGVDWGDIEIAPPFVTFEDRLSVFVDDLEVQAELVGPAHTTNDVVYHVPDRKLLFAGDVAFNGGTPFVLMGSVQGSLDAYERLAGLDVETVVPGHGAVCDPSVFDRMAGYLRWIQELGRDAEASDTPPLEAARSVELGEYADWHDSERIVANIHRALSELRGEPLGVELQLGPIIADMVAYNGGRPLQCLA